MSDLDGSSNVVSLTGTSGAVDAKKTLIKYTQDSGSNAGDTFFQHTPTESGSDSWFQGSYDFSNTHGTRHNHVWSMGWNLKPSPTEFTAGRGAIGIGFENHYEPDASNSYFEHHVYFITTAAAQRRPISWQMHKTTNAIYGAIECEKMTFYNQSGGLQTMQINPTQGGAQGVANVTLGRFNQLPVELRNENNNSAFLLQNGTSGQGVYVEIARVNASNEVELAHGAAPIRCSGTLKCGADSDTTNVNCRINGKTATTATAGTAGAPPAQVVGYLSVNINGTERKMPYYAV